jgi:hypothetical protein
MSTDTLLVAGQPSDLDTILLSIAVFATMRVRPWRSIKRASHYAKYRAKFYAK